PRSVSNAPAFGLHPVAGKAVALLSAHFDARFGESVGCDPAAGKAALRGAGHERAVAPGGGPRNAQPARDLGADGHDFEIAQGRQHALVAFVAPVVAAGKAEQAGGDEHGHSSSPGETMLRPASPCAPRMLTLRPSTVTRPSAQRRMAQG